MFQKEILSNGVVVMGVSQTHSLTGKQAIFKTGCYNLVDKKVMKSMSSNFTGYIEVHLVPIELLARNVFPTDLPSYLSVLGYKMIDPILACSLYSSQFEPFTDLYPFFVQWRDEYGKLCKIAFPGWNSDLEWYVDGGYVRYEDNPILHKWFIPCTKL